MTIEQFVNAMNILGTIYNKDFDQATISVWYKFFRDTSYDDLMIAIERVGEKERFMPSVARLKEEISTFTNPELQLNVDEEWDAVRYCIRYFGPYKEEDAMEYLNPVTRKVVQSLDYQRLMSVPTDEMQYEYERFKKSFMGYTKTLTDASVTSASARTLIENKRMEELKMHNEGTLNLLGEHYE